MVIRLIKFVFLLFRIDSECLLLLTNLVTASIRDLKLTISKLQSLKVPTSLVSWNSFNNTILGIHFFFIEWGKPNYVNLKMLERNSCLDIVLVGKAAAKRNYPRPNPAFYYLIPLEQYCCHQEGGDLCSCSFLQAGTVYTHTCQALYV